MANDLIRRNRVIDEWLSEIHTIRGLIEHDDIDGTGLSPVRREILAQMDRLADFATSKKAGFSPFKAIADAQEK